MNFEGRIMCMSFLRGESEEEINVKFGCEKNSCSIGK
jgi:hypothetical protein